MSKSAIAVMSGVLVGLVMIMAIESIGHSLFPLSEEVEFIDPASLKQVMHFVPLPALLSVLAAWLLGSFSGGFLASLLAPAKRTAHALTAGMALMLAGIVNLLLIPHPAWFILAGILLFLPAAWLGDATAALVLCSDPDPNDPRRKLN
ncbi:MAG TPA: hypothetical protein PKN04_01320 [bacterium]|jgi:hypothetical protein|nr:hypothetical protein [bacterium]HNT64400.1 hypothetical protein [bacterium]HOX84752.1 hypothetical protein [bacterium]HPG45475.1 hypothetical protein [bacterium]HPM96749.1 hypothetical protein [bacterium]